MDILRSSVSSGLDTEFVVFISFTGSANTSPILLALPEALHHVAGDYLPILRNPVKLLSIGKLASTSLPRVLPWARIFKFRCDI